VVLWVKALGEPGVVLVRRYVVSILHRSHPFLRPGPSNRSIALIVPVGDVLAALDGHDRLAPTKTSQDQVRASKAKALTVSLSERVRAVSCQVVVTQARAMAFTWRASVPQHPPST
jgi:hypothetical protein